MLPRTGLAALAGVLLAAAYAPFDVPWVIPVAAYDGRGRPATRSNLGTSLGRRGLGAPGEWVESLRPGGGFRGGGGTSSAAAFVTGALALLASLHPRAPAAELRAAITAGGRRRAVAAPALDGEGALAWLRATTTLAGAA